MRHCLIKSACISRAEIWTLDEAMFKIIVSFCWHRVKCFYYQKIKLLFSTVKNYMHKPLDLQSVAYVSAIEVEISDSVHYETMVLHCMSF